LGLGLLQSKNRKKTNLGIEKQLKEEVPLKRERRGTVRINNN
jgi:hypothetical protein